MRFQLRSLIFAASAAAVVAGCENPSDPGDGKVELRDVTGPAVELVHPADGAMAGLDKVYVQATLTDSAGVVRAAYSVDGGPEQPLTMSPGASAGVAEWVVVPAGKHQLTVHAYDAAGNRGSAAREVWRGPTFLGRFHLTTVADGKTFRSPSIDLRIYGDLSQLASAVYRLNGGPEVGFTRQMHHASAWFGAGARLRDGDNVLDVRVTDTSGSSESQTLRVRYHEPVIFGLGGDRLVTTDTAAYNVSLQHSAGITGAAYRVGSGAETAVPVTPASTANAFRVQFTARIPSAGATTVTIIATDGIGRRDSIITRVARSLPPTAAGVFTQVAAGQEHTCGVTTAGKAYCWGNGTEGQIGDGHFLSRLAPAPVSTTLTFRAVTANRGGFAADAGGGFSCGLTTRGAAYCWGESGFGQLGTGAPFQSRTNVPVPVLGERTYAEIAAGARHACAVAADGQAWCWGANEYGQLGDGTTRPAAGVGSQPRPPSAVTGISLRSIAAAVNHTCGVGTDGAVYCWGRNEAGQLGVGGVAQSSTPVKPAGELRFRSVAAADVFTCGLTDGGEVYCWGGEGTSAAPAPRLIGRGFAALAAGGNRACGIQDSAVRCWPAGGQLYTVASPEPLKLRSVAVAGTTVCAVAENNAAYCAGEGRAGRLGNGTEVFSPGLFRILDP